MIVTEHQSQCAVSLLVVVYLVLLAEQCSRPPELAKQQSVPQSLLLYAVFSRCLFTSRCLLHLQQSQMRVKQLRPIRAWGLRVIKVMDAELRHMVPICD